MSSVTEIFFTKSYNEEYLIWHFVIFVIVMIVSLAIIFYIMLKQILKFGFVMFVMCMMCVRVDQIEIQVDRAREKIVYIDQKL